MSCPNSGKIQYESQKEAEFALEKMRKRYTDSTNHESYFCMYCENWHLGRRSERPKRKKRKRT